MQEHVSVDKVEDAMFELEETLANQQEIDQVFTKSLASTEVNDEELEQELEILVNQERDNVVSEAASARGKDDKR